VVGPEQERGRAGTCRHIKREGEKEKGRGRVNKGKKRNIIKGGPIRRKKKREVLQSQKSEREADTMKYEGGDKKESKREVKGDTGGPEKSTSRSEGKICRGKRWTIVNFSGNTRAIEPRAKGKLLSRRKGRYG